VAVEVRFTDGGTLPVRLRETALELATKYGTVRVPLAEVRRVEVATRVAADTAERVEAAVDRLGHPDFRTRTRAEAELRDLQVRAYPLLLKAAKLPDPETARRAEAIVQALRRQVPADDLRVREFDVVHTDDGPFTGRLVGDSFRVGTAQFGEQTLRLADVREIRHNDRPAVVASAAPPAPTNLVEYQSRFGTELEFAVTGHQPGPAAVGWVVPPPPPGLPAAPVVVGPNNAAVWGTDVYTLDSHLAAAAVHAGVVLPGQTATVRVRILVSPPGYSGSVRNGVASQGYNFYPPGAYEFLRP
jgi:hypothetical protein